MKHEDTRRRNRRVVSYITKTHVSMQKAMKKFELSYQVMYGLYRQAGIPTNRLTQALIMKRNQKILKMYKGLVTVEDICRHFSLSKNHVQNVLKMEISKAFAENEKLAWYKIKGAHTLLDYKLAMLTEESIKEERGISVDELHLCSNIPIGLCRRFMKRMEMAI